MAQAAPQWLGTMQGGKVQWDRPQEFARHSRSLEGQRVVATLGKYRKRRSGQQNKAYWALVIGILSEHTGYEPEEIHEALKLKFLGLENPDDPLPRVKSTTSLTTVEWEEFVGRVRRWAAEYLDCQIPEPNEVAA